jgi:hypothetical protein
MDTWGASNPKRAPAVAFDEVLSELLGFEVAQSSIAKYMVKRHGPLSLPKTLSKLN